MQLFDIIERAAEGYDQTMPSLCHHMKNDAPLSAKDYERAGLRDLLGRFIVVELCDAFNPHELDEEQLETAADVIRTAILDLQGVLWQLERREDVSSPEA